MNEMRMPIRTRVVEMDGDYAGFQATMRVNVSMRTLEALSTTDDLYHEVAQLVHDWNFVDDDGNPLPLGDQDNPLKPDIILTGLRTLPIELFQMLQRKYSEALTSPLAATTLPASSKPPSPAASPRRRSSRS